MTRYHLWIETADGAVLEDVYHAENARQACYLAGADHLRFTFITARAADDADDEFTYEQGVWF